MGDNRKSRVVLIGYGLSDKGAFIPFGKQLSGRLVSRSRRKREPAMADDQQKHSFV